MHQRQIYLYCFSLVLPLSHDLFLLSSFLPLFLSLLISLCLSSLSEMRDLSLREKRDRERSREGQKRGGERELECRESAYLATTMKAIVTKAMTTNAGVPLP